MPTVIIEGDLQLVINTRENPFEAPHVHVRIGGKNVCRIRLRDAAFMEEPPPGTARKIMDVYTKYSDRINEMWKAIHKR